jgi:hypothetical protein
MGGGIPKSSNKNLGLPKALILLEFLSEFRSKLVSTFDEIINRNYAEIIPTFDSISMIGI